jgi:hypothetical protein
MTKKVKMKRWKIIILSIIVLLVIVRLIMPYFVLKYVNKTLAEIKGYYGHVEDIDIALIRGAYKINDLLIVKVDTVTNQKDTTPFFKTPSVDLSVEWKAIFKGSIVGEIEVEDPVLNFVKGKHKHEDVKEDTTSFQNVIRKLMPLTINRFQINNGQIHFIDHYSSPQIDIPMKNISVLASNLSNVNDSNKVLPSAIKATADVYDGKMDLNVKLDPMQKKPTFDLNAKVDKVNMVHLNNFFKAYGKFEVEKGSFGLYTEFAGKDGAFTGYVKPLITDMKVKKEGNMIQIGWQTLVQGAEKLLENNKTEKSGTKMPIKGKFDDPNTGLWTAISYTLKNAFIFALKPSIDNEIDIGKVEKEPEQKETFLQKIFGKKDKDKDKKKDKEKKNK